MSICTMELYFIFCDLSVKPKRNATQDSTDDHDFTSHYALYFGSKKTEDILLEYHGNATIRVEFLIDRLSRHIFDHVIGDKRNSERVRAMFKCSYSSSELDIVDIFISDIASCVSIEDECKLRAKAIKDSKTTKRGIRQLNAGNGTVRLINLKE